MLPKTGRKLHPTSPDGLAGGAFATSIAKALRSELGSTHQSIKTAMRWTGASERTTKHWFSGTHGPNGEHLVSLARHSDEVLLVFLAMADRKPYSVAARFTELRHHLLAIVDYIDEQT